MASLLSTPPTTYRIEYRTPGGSIKTLTHTSATPLSPGHWITADDVLLHVDRAIPGMRGDHITLLCSLVPTAGA